MYLFFPPLLLGFFIPASDLITVSTVEKDTNPLAIPINIVVTILIPHLILQDLLALSNNPEPADESVVAEERVKFEEMVE